MTRSRALPLAAQRLQQQLAADPDLWIEVTLVDAETVSYPQVVRARPRTTGPAGGVETAVVLGDTVATATVNALLRRGLLRAAPVSPGASPGAPRHLRPR